MATMVLKSPESIQPPLRRSVESEEKRDNQSTDREMQAALRRLAATQAREQGDQL